MKAISVRVVEVMTNRRVVEAVIVSDDTPATLPTTGEGIDGLLKTDVFAPFSLLYVVNPAAAHQVYIANESGAFVGQ